MASPILTEITFPDSSCLKVSTTLKVNNTFQCFYTCRGGASTPIPWIERLLGRGLPDHRKYVISIVLVPYFINIKDLPKEDAVSRINQWLSKCNTCKPLDSTYDFDSSLNYYINRCQINNSLKPIRFDRLIESNPELRKIIEGIGNHD